MKNRRLLSGFILSLLLSLLLSPTLSVSVFALAQAQVPMEYQSRTISFPAKKTQPKESVVDKVDSGSVKAEIEPGSGAEPEWNKINLVEYTTPRLSPELIEMGQQVDALLEQDSIDINTVRAFQLKGELFLAYIEHELNFVENKTRHIQLIELTAFLIGPPATAKLLDWGALFRKQPYRLRALIRALSNWPSTKETDAFVHSILGAEVPSPVVIPLALLYQAWNKNQSARAFTGQYSVPQAGRHYQYLSLYLAGALGDKAFLPFIVQAFKNKPPAYQQYYLLLALSKLLGPGDYKQIVRGLDITAGIKNSVQRQAVFVRSKDKKPAQVLSAMRGSVYEEERALAIDYLIAQKNYLMLAEWIKTQGPLGIRIYHQARFAGLSAEQLGFSAPAQNTHPGDVVALAEKETVEHWPLPVWLWVLMGVVVASAMVSGLLFMIKARGSQVVGAVFLK